MEINKIINSECLEGMRKLPDNCIDSLITDPPYGIKFMSKKWDIQTPSVEIWKECLRVLKPGAFAFIMMTPRQDCFAETVMRLNEVGFVTGFTSIYWTYAVGFPKSMNIGKAIDKRLGKERERTKNDNGINKNKDVLKYGFTDEKISNEPISEEAKKFKNAYAGYAPKPAVEIIIVVMKSLNSKSYIDQALENGKGLTYLGNVRIPYKQDELTNEKFGKRGNLNTTSEQKYGYKNCVEIGSPEGRFPANLLVNDDALNNGIISKGQLASTTGNEPNKSKLNLIYGDYRKYGKITKPRGDYGSVSRYFSLDNWFEKHLSKLPESIQKTFPFLIVPKPSKAEKNKGCENLPTKIQHRLRPDKNELTGLNKEPRWMPKETKNVHPTVKSLKLMHYLITLGSREGDLILDPFCGSGSTCLAAKQLDRNYIGYEMESEYHAIAEARVGSYKQNNLNKWIKKRGE